MNNSLNPHNKIGIPIVFNKKEMMKLYKNENFQLLMNWLESSLRKSNMIISDQFYHPSFTRRERELIEAVIYSCYDVVKTIEPLGKNGVVISCSKPLTMTKLPGFVESN